MEEKRILVCEDEDAIRDFVVIHLRRSGYDVYDVDSGEKAIEAWKSGKRFDVALLDIMMPGIDGTQVCRFLRGESSTIGIIMLSAKSQEMDKVNCLMMGADDYVTKPFSPSELIARVDAIYRRVSVSRSAGESESELESGPFRVDLKSRRITKNGVPLEITQVEYHIIEFFIRSDGNAIDRRTLLNKIWGEGYYGDDKIVDVNIRRIRMKIEDDPSAPKYIQTVWGFGYKWGDGKEKAEES
ncbi:MAG: response regulator transcription factor [Ruminiclostridium sp.]|nr:response regulator transcription factor [Ruminiclostridium sp.]MBR0134568.1 response regulator transcription factor [Clostridia bacterium]